MDTLRNKKIVVTGSHGYIAKAIVNQLKPIVSNIVKISHKKTNEVGFKHGDLCSVNFWKTILPETDIIFHLAALTSLRECETSPIKSIHANVTPTLAILEACKELNIHPILIFAGTATQVGVTPSLPVDESTPSHPVTMYDYHKQIAEQHISMASRNNILTGITLRLGNVYGPGLHDNHKDRGIINKLVKQCLQGKNIKVYGDGQCMRDYIYVNDVANAFVQAAIHANKLSGKFFYIASGTGYTLQEAFQIIIDRVKKHTGQSNLIEYIPWPDDIFEIEKRNFVANINVFSSLTSWSPQTDYIDGIDETISHYKDGAVYEQSN